VIGYPISHSLSPKIHAYWLAQHDIPMRYEKIEVAPDKLESFLATLGDNQFYGINLTLPHKHQAYQFAQQQNWIIHRAAKQAQSINIIKCEDSQCSAYSSDGEGFVLSLSEHHLWQAEPPLLILGAGGAAAAIAMCLADKGAQYIRLCNRTHAKAEQLAAKINHVKKVEIIAWQERHEALADTQLLIQTTSLGMRGQPPLDLNLDALPPSASVADIVYQPLRTPLLQQAYARGNKIIDGLGMLLYQAQIAFELWFDIKPEITPTLRKQLEKAL